MKIGIITIHKSPNYGACLQAYALWKYLEQKGNDCEIIDLYRPYQEEYVPSKRFQRMRQHTSFVSRCKQAIKKMLGLNKGKAGKLFSDNAKLKFDKFNSQIKYSKAYKGIDELYANPPIYDLYVSGSDQLWNPTQPYCLEPYFLTFVPNGGRKISYATSIGITDLTDEEKHKFKDWLSSYDAISVRELQAEKLLESFITDHVISQVPDPTFLLDVEEWKKLAVSPDINEKYILLFTLQWSPVLVDYCKRLSAESGLLLVVLTQIQPQNNGGGYIPVTDAGPKEFIGYIANAEMVITDSFHCTVFSIITGANNFYTYIAPSNIRGSRITDLLDIFEIKGHLLPQSLSLGYAELAKCKIEHEQIKEKMFAIRQQGMTFINKYINQ